MKQKAQTFTGQDINTTTTGTVTVSTYPSEVKYDKVEYCPFCGKKLPDTNNTIIYCPYCGKQIPQITTQGMFIYHWNYPDGTSSWPKDGIIEPYIIYNTK